MPTTCTYTYITCHGCSNIMCVTVTSHFMDVPISCAGSMWVGSRTMHIWSPRWHYHLFTLSRSSHGATWVCQCTLVGNPTWKRLSFVNTSIMSASPLYLQTGRTSQAQKKNSGPAKLTLSWKWKTFWEQGYRQASQTTV
jgi:hypothetical protein